MILFNKLVNHNCTDQTAQTGLWLCCSQMPKAGFHMQRPLNAKIIKEDNSSVFTADEKLGGAKQKIFNWFSQFIHICSQVASDNDCIYPYKLIAGSLSTVKDGDQTDVNLQHNILLD